MPKLLKLALMPICLAVTACATPRTPISIGLGPITCPQSLLENDPAPEAIDPNVVRNLPDDIQVYLLAYLSQWEDWGARQVDKHGQSLEACSDYNHQLRELENARTRLD